MLNLKWKESVKEKFKELQIMTVYGLYIYETILFVNKNKSLNNTVGAHHHYSTRYANDIEIRRHNLEFYKKKPSVAGARFFNALPPELKNKAESTGFNRTLKDFLIQKSLYSFNEFFQ